MNELEQAKRELALVQEQIKQKEISRLKEELEKTQAAIQAKKDEDRTILQRAEDLAGGIARTGAAILPGIMDIPGIPYNLYKMAKGEEGYSHALKAKEAFDKETGGKYKPTTPLGKTAEIVGDLFAPSLAGKASAAIKVLGPVIKAGGKYLEKGSELLQNAPILRNALKIGKKQTNVSAGKVVDSLIGPKAISNAFISPTVGNTAGALISHGLTNEDSGVMPLLGGVGSGIAIDTMKTLLGKGLKKGWKATKDTYQTTKLMDPDVKKAVDELAYAKNLEKFYKEQQKTIAKEEGAKSSIAQKNQRNIEKHEKSVKDAENNYKKAMQEYKKSVQKHEDDYKKSLKDYEVEYENKQRQSHEETQAQQKAKYEKDLENYQKDMEVHNLGREANELPDEVQSLVEQQTSQKGGQAATEAANIQHAANQELNQELFAPKAVIEEAAGHGLYVDNTDAINAIREKFEKVNSPRAAEDFFKGHDGKVYKRILGVPANADPEVCMDALYHNPPMSLSFNDVNEILDMSRGSKGTQDTVTKGEAGNIKFVAGKLDKAKKIAEKSLAPEAFEDLTEARTIYGKQADTEHPTINTANELKNRPVEFQKKIEADLSNDALDYNVTKNPETTLTVYRNFGLDSKGEFSPRRAAEKLMGLEENVRNSIFENLPKETQKEIVDNYHKVKNVNKVESDYKAEKEVPKAPKEYSYEEYDPKASRPERQPKPEKPERQPKPEKPEKVEYEGKTTVPYDKKTVTGLKKYIEKHPETDRNVLTSRKDVQDAMKIEDMLNKKDINRKWWNPVRGLHAGQKALFGDTLQDTAPDILEVIQRKALNPKSTISPIRELGKETVKTVKESAKKVPVARLENQILQNVEEKNKRKALRLTQYPHYGGYPRARQ